MVSRFESTFRDRVIPAAERAFGVTVTFSSGASVSDEFTARRSDRTYQAIGELGIEVLIAMRDFVLPVASVVINGAVVEPRTGHRITEGEEVFEILPPNENTPSVELQAGSYEWLVHTKRVE